MNDPSQLVLALTFVFTLVFAMTAIGVRWWARYDRMTAGEEASPEPPTDQDGGPPPLRQDGPPSLHRNTPPTLHRNTPPTLPMGKVKTWFYRPWDLAGAMVLYLIFAGLFTLSCVVKQPEGAQHFTAGALLFNIMFQCMLAGGVAAVALRLSNPNQWLGWRWKHWPWLFLIAPGAVALMLGIFWLIQLSGYMQWMESLGAETIQDTVTLLQECRDPLVLILLVFTATLVAPVCEEIVFRGYLYPILKKYGGIWVGAFCSSLLFSIAHGNMAVMLPLFLLGAILVWLYEVTGSIWTPIAVHFCFNATTVFAQLATRNADIPSALLPYLPFHP